MKQHEIVSLLLDLDRRLKVIESWSDDPITDKQIDFIANLIRELPEPYKENATEKLEEISKFSKGEASAFIDGLIQLRDDVRKGNTK